MNCHRARQLLFDFFDGLSNEALRAEVDRHLGECEECDRFATEMTRSLALLRRAPVEPLDENFNWKVRLAIHREKNAALARANSAGAWVRMWNIRYAVSSGLAFAVVLAVGALALHNGVVPAPAGLATTVTTPAQDVANSADETSPVTTDPSAHMLVPRSSFNAVGPDRSHLVAAGAEREGRGTAPVGAIDQVSREARIDSLINEEVKNMTPEQRQIYLQRRIQRFLSNLQGQQSTPHQP
ncbi:MAG TPA: zf-HC2 domain-containing protein [Candidatus Krumholzibacteria bacterium]|nr:zf-HC2 domain-containing protein [Candidatus Krumholzibacteria bacterium]